MMRGRLSAVGLALVLLLGALVGLAPGSAVAMGTTSGQVVTVTVANSTTTWATVEAWQRQADGRYLRMAQFPLARVGAAGVGIASESVSRTPAGQFRLGWGFGVQPNPGAGVPWTAVGRDDVWTSSLGSVINQHRLCAPGTCPASYGAIERLSTYPQQYAYGAVIGYNMLAPYGTGAVRGKGSAFFLHVSNAYATGGCVAVSQSQMIWLLRWMKTAQTPIISIGVGAAAYAPIPYRYL